jgi:hypothetical protein
MESVNKLAKRHPKHLILMDEMNFDEISLENIALTSVNYFCVV